MLSRCKLVLLMYKKQAYFFICLYKIITMYPLDRTMRLIRMASLKVSSTENMCCIKSMGKKEEEFVTYIKLSEVKLVIATIVIKR